MTVLLTGAAGFIGYHVAEALLARGETIIGVDNLNDYYDVSLKEKRLENLQKHNGFMFQKLDIAEREEVENLFSNHGDITRILHLAAQAGVRYSLENPYSYTRSNIEGQLVLLEAARNIGELKHFVYASSSSVYGANTKLPYAAEDRTDEPLSVYAATKKSAEIMSHAYAHLYGLPLTGLRFFTVYGPWGRPDMAYFLFTKKILNGEPIPIFNNGEMRRNFTYIDDVVSGVISCLYGDLAAEGKAKALNRIYNIGNNQSESLMDFVKEIEQAIGISAAYDFQPMQPGDVKETVADISTSVQDFGFAPKTSIQQGIPKFVEWYRSYYE
jgi:UDP-glucuronate 4-epimerase